MAFTERQAQACSAALLISTLVDSLSLNIELIEMIAERSSPEMRASLGFQAMMLRVEALKAERDFFQGAQLVQGEATWQ